jgi:hypothetical protein
LRKEVAQGGKGLSSDPSRPGRPKGRQGGDVTLVLVRPEAPNPDALEAVYRILASSRPTKYVDLPQGVPGGGGES